ARWVALQQDVVRRDALVDGADLFELRLPVGTVLALGRRLGGAEAGGVDVEDRQAGAVAFGEGDGVEVRLVGVGREVGRVKDGSDANHGTPPRGGVGEGNGCRPLTPHVTKGAGAPQILSSAARPRSARGAYSGRHVTGMVIVSRAGRLNSTWTALRK